jgi:hypothetical protein
MSNNKNKKLIKSIPNHVWESLIKYNTQFKGFINRKNKNDNPVYNTHNKAMLQKEKEEIQKYLKLLTVTVPPPPPPPHTFLIVKYLKHTNVLKPNKLKYFKQLNKSIIPNIFKEVTAENLFNRNYIVSKITNLKSPNHNREFGNGQIPSLIAAWRTAKGLPKPEYGETGKRIGPHSPNNGNVNPDYRPNFEIYNNGPTNGNVKPPNGKRGNKIHRNPTGRTPRTLTSHTVRMPPNSRGTTIVPGLFVPRPGSARTTGLPPTGTLIRLPLPERIFK